MNTTSNRAEEQRRLDERSGSQPQKGDCNETDGFSFCTEPAGHGPVHWDRRTQHEWSDEETDGAAEQHAEQTGGPR
jgi:hypothetical protein